MGKARTETRRKAVGTTARLTDTLPPEAISDELIAAHGERMAQLLGRDDMLNSPTGADYSKLVKTFNNAKR